MIMTPLVLARETYHTEGDPRRPERFSNQLEAGIRTGFQPVAQSDKISSGGPTPKRVVQPSQETCCRTIRVPLSPAKAAGNLNRLVITTTAPASPQ